MKFLFIGVFAFLFLYVGAVVAANDNYPSESDLVGTFAAKYSTGTYTLTLNEDGTYTQSVSLHAGGTPITNSGTWAYDDDEHELDLRDCIAVVDGFGEIQANLEEQPKGRCIPPARWSRLLFGKVCLGGGEVNPRPCKVD